MIFRARYCQTGPAIDEKWVCLYRDFNFRGTLWSWRGDRSLSCIGNGPKTVRFYEHENYHGKHVCIGNWNGVPTTGSGTCGATASTTRSARSKSESPARTDPMTRNAPDHR